jgi:hypothetical protein
VTNIREHVQDTRVYRWWWNRTILFREPFIFMLNHPRIARALDLAYEKSVVLRDKVSSFWDSVQNAALVNAIHETTGEPKNTIKYWKYSGESASDIYAWARERGWRP